MFDVHVPGVVFGRNPCEGVQGVLYMECMKTACEDIYTIAFAMQKDNESIEGWTRFL